MSLYHLCSGRGDVSVTSQTVWHSSWHDTAFHSVQAAYTDLMLALHTIRADETLPSYISAVLPALLK